MRCVWLVEPWVTGLTAALRRRYGYHTATIDIYTSLAVIVVVVGCAFIYGIVAYATVAVG